jgi:hypothetical protein
MARILIASGPADYADTIYTALKIWGHSPTRSHTLDDTVKLLLRKDFALLMAPLASMAVDGIKLFQIVRGRIESENEKAEIISKYFCSGQGYDAFVQRKKVMRLMTMEHCRELTQMVERMGFTDEYGNVRINRDTSSPDLDDLKAKLDRYFG